MKSLLTDISLPFAIIFLGIAAVCFYIARQQDAHALALTGGGRITAAELVNKTSFTSSGAHKQAGFGEHGATTYTVHYRFTLPETGEVREATSNVAPEVWQAMQVGQHYQLVYSADDPALASLFNGQDFINGARLAYRIAGVCLLLGLLFAGLCWKLSV